MGNCASLIYLTYGPITAISPSLLQEGAHKLRIERKVESSKEKLPPMALDRSRIFSEPLLVFSCLLCFQYTSICMSDRLRMLAVAVAFMKEQTRVLDSVFCCCSQLMSSRTRSSKIYNCVLDLR
jgi:hypothetical protein